MKIIQANEVTRHNHNVHITWDDPETGEELWVQGEFNIVDEHYSHIVTDDEGNPIYEVQGQ